MKRTHRAVATVGTFTDRETGQEKKKYHTCGHAFTENGQVTAIKIEALPVPAGEWNGFLNLYPLDDDPS